MLHIPDIDKIFTDFERAFNSFVENRIALEMAESSFKDAVRSYEDIHPSETLSAYVNALRTTLAREGIVIKIQQGIATFSGAIERVDHAAMRAKEAVENILSASEKLLKMAPNIAHSSEDCIATIKGLNIENTIKSESSNPMHAMQTLRLFKDNCKTMKKVPKMVKDFTNEVEKISDELMIAFGERKNEPGPSSKCDDDKSNNDTKKKKKTRGDEAKKGNEEHTTEKKDKGKKGKEQEEADYEKALKMEYIDVPDFDYLFQDFASAINPFVTSREKMEKARKSFETTMNMLETFDAEKELREYFKVLKKKAAKDEIHVYIDVTDGEIYVKSLSGIPTPKPYRDAVKCINDIKTCAIQLLEMEPQIERGVQSVGDDLSKISPFNDLRRVLQFKDLPKIRGKVKKFRNNLKKVEKSPKIIKDFLSYVKKTLSDIKEFFEQEESQ